MFFKNLKIKNSKIINIIASATFGVLCIHAASDNMRNWLWSSTLNVVGFHSTGNGYIHMILSILGVYSICTALDIVRIYILEKSLFKQLDKLIPKINEKYTAFENKVCKKLHIR